MYSSRMRTVRSSGRISGGGMSARGGVCSQGVSAPGGVCSGGCLLLGGLLWGVSTPGGCLLPGGVVSQHALRQTPTPLCGQTDACKNITFATSLRTVKIHKRLLNLFLNVRSSYLRILLKAEHF